MGLDLKMWLMQVTDLAAGALDMLVGVATTWELDLAMFCCEDVNLVMDLCNPPLEGKLKSVEMTEFFRHSHFT